MGMEGEMKRKRPHSNNKGRRHIQRGKTQSDIERIGRKLGVKVIK